MIAPSVGAEQTFPKSVFVTLVVVRVVSVVFAPERQLLLCQVRTLVD